jgi:hypothetical protein
MVIKGEYITWDERKLNKGGYVFQDYKLGQVIYHFTNLVVCTNLQVQTMLSKNSLKVWYFLPYYEHDKLMETPCLGFPFHYMPFLSFNFHAMPFLSFNFHAMPFLSMPFLALPSLSTPCHSFRYITLHSIPCRSFP